MTTYEKTRIDAGAWVVVCDGRKALLLVNTGDERFPNLRTREVLEHSNPPTSAQGTDAPGRVHQSVGSARSSVEPTDWHDEAEREFLRNLAEILERAIAGGETNALVVAAAPRALGVLRGAYGHATQKALKAEIDRDLVKLPVYEIEKMLAA